MVNDMSTISVDHIQAHSGIFHMLPLGNRVQQKLENLIDKHMASLGNDFYFFCLSLNEVLIRSRRFQGIHVLHINRGAMAKDW